MFNRRHEHEPATVSPQSRIGRIVSGRVIPATSDRVKTGHLKDVKSLRILISTSGTERTNDVAATQDGRYSGDPGSASCGDSQREIARLTGVHREPVSRFVSEGEPKPAKPDHRVSSGPRNACEPLRDTILQSKRPTQR